MEMDVVLYELLRQDILELEPHQQLPIRVHRYEVTEKELERKHVMMLIVPQGTVVQVHEQ